MVTIPMAQAVKDYIIDLVVATRQPGRVAPALQGLGELIAYGASPP